MPQDRRATVSRKRSVADTYAAEPASKDDAKKALVMHFMMQLGIIEDADAVLREHDMGRVHHRILYFAHFAPGITVTDLLSVLSVKHQNIQPALKQLTTEGYVLAKMSEKDARVKKLYCSRQGDKLLQALSSGQWKRFGNGFASVNQRDVKGYFAVLEAMLDEDRREWVKRLTASDE